MKKRTLITKRIFTLALISSMVWGILPNNVWADDEPVAEIVEEVYENQEEIYGDEELQIYEPEALEYESYEFEEAQPYEVGPQDLEYESFEVQPEEAEVLEA